MPDSGWPLSAPGRRPSPAARERAQAKPRQAPFPPTPSPTATQGEWAWCYKCQGLFYGPHQSSSTCPYGGNHNGGESEHYELAYGATGTISGTQSDWDWCYKCQGLFYNHDQSSSLCPATGRHSGAESNDYVISTSTSNLIPAVIAFQASWARCGNCQGLFYGPHQSTSWCPTGYAHSAADNTDSPTWATTSTYPTAPLGDVSETQTAERGDRLGAAGRHRA